VVPTLERVHPTPVYEMIGLALILWVLWRQAPATMRLGHLLGQYLVYSGALRFVIEFVRRNPNWLLGLTTAQWMSLASIAVGAWLIATARDPLPDPAALAAAPPPRDQPREPFF